MANITRFDPFGDLARFDPLRDIDYFFRVPRTRHLWRNLPVEPQIKMDVTEDEKAYHVKAEIPGVKKEDIKVSIDGNQVSIGAEVKRDKEEKQGEKVLRTERYYGKVSRTFTLAQDVDQDNASAKYENGVLELTLPKRATATQKRLTVQ